MSLSLHRPTRLLTVVLAAGTLAACGPPARPDATFNLTFEGETSCSLAGVGAVRISIPAASVELEERCGTGGITVIVPDLPPGTYDALFQALDVAGGTVLYSGREQVIHTRAGTHRYEVDLAGVTEVVARFSFDSGLSCAQAGVARVTLDFTSRSFEAPRRYDVPCSAGGHDATAITDLAPGRWDLRAEGFDLAGARTHGATFLDLNVVRGASNDFTLELSAEAPEVIAAFLFASANEADPGLSCAEARVTKVTLRFTAPGATTRDYEVDCSSNGIAGTVLTDLPAGTWDLALDAFDEAGRRLYASDFDDLQIVRGASQTFELNALPSVKGGLELTWAFDRAGTVTESCATAGVDQLAFTLTNRTGGRFHYTWSCSDGPIRFRWDDPQGAFEPGRYTLESAHAYPPNSFTPVFSVANVELYVPAGRDQGFVVTLN